MIDLEKNKGIEIYQENTCSVDGEYSIEIIKADGSIEQPLGDFKYKNLILDSFFSSILNGYSFGIQSFIQSCRVGSSSSAATQSQTGLQGTQLSETHASSYFNTSVDESTNTISMTRDFTFPIVSTQTTYREAVVGCFGISSVDNITTSRFVFPGEIIVLAGDRLKIIYTLNIRLNYIFNDTPISVGIGNLDFTGKIRMSANNTGIFSIISGNNTYIPLGNTTEYVFRDFTSNSVSATRASAAHSSVGAYQNIFGTPTWANKVGFFPPGHAPYNYPSGVNTYTPVGDVAQITRTAPTITSASGYVTMEYFFPQFLGERQVDGIYLWNYNNTNSRSAIYYKFNSTQTIPAISPIILKLRWVFVRN